VGISQEGGSEEDNRTVIVLKLGGRHMLGPRKKVSTPVFRSKSCYRQPGKFRVGTHQTMLETTIRGNTGGAITNLRP